MVGVLADFQGAKKVFTLGDRYHGAILVTAEDGTIGVMTGDSIVLPFDSVKAAKDWIDTDPADEQKSTIIS